MHTKSVQNNGTTRSLNASILGLNTVCCITKFVCILELTSIGVPTVCNIKTNK